MRSSNLLRSTAMNASFTPMPPATTASIAAADPSGPSIVKPRADGGETTAFKVLGFLSFSHFLNDMIQSLILAIYPLLKGEFSLSFVQIGLITLTYQITASLLQPLIGLYTDKHPQPRSLSSCTHEVGDGVGLQRAQREGESTMTQTSG